MITRNLTRAIKSMRVGLLVCDLGQAALCGMMAAYAGSRGELGWSAALAFGSLIGAAIAGVSFRVRKPAPPTNDITITVTRETTPGELAGELIAAFNVVRRRGST